MVYCTRIYQRSKTAAYLDVLRWVFSVRGPLPLVGGSSSSRVCVFMFAGAGAPAHKSMEYVMRQQAVSANRRTGFGSYRENRSVSHFAHVGARPLPSEARVSHTPWVQRFDKLTTARLRPYNLRLTAPLSEANL